MHFLNPLKQIPLDQSQNIVAEIVAELFQHYHDMKDIGIIIGLIIEQTRLKIPPTVNYVVVIFRRRKTLPDIKDLLLLNVNKTKEHKIGLRTPFIAVCVKSFFRSPITMKGIGNLIIRTLIQSKFMITLYTI